MARTRIGGTVDYARLAQLHRPTTEDGLRSEARRMVARGLKPRDIAMHLALSEAAVTQLLQDAPIASRDA